MTDKTEKTAPSTVHFVGAGPGDPELITIKGQRLLQNADVVVYAGSLVNPRLLENCPRHCERYDSAAMDLEQIVEIMSKAAVLGKAVVRLHTGDPSIYGSINEQMNELQKKGISFKVVPGVSAFCGAAASLKRQLTLPDSTQTVILTRVGGRTPVPDSEDLEKLAAHGSSMVIFLSTGHIRRVTAKLMKQLPPETPAAVVYKATWPDEIIIRGTLDTIAPKVREAGIEKTALILVGQWVDQWSQCSRLYDPTFSHEYRTARK
jgi:precorrin-4/cobalt-precorrin-4 C11-methyltransferase